MNSESGGVGEVAGKCLRCLAAREGNVCHEDTQSRFTLHTLS